jgi:hypothetical protein
MLAGVFSFQEYSIMSGENNGLPEAPAGVTSIADSILGQLPDVQEHAVAQALAESGDGGGADSTSSAGGDAGGNAGAAASAGESDASGARFDAAIHSTGADGKGILNASGHWRKKRKSKVAGDKPSASTPAAVEGAMTPQQQAQARMAGMAAAQATFLTGRMFGGDEWIPVVRTVDTPDGKKASMDERAMIEGAYGDYFIATGKTDFPPGVALFMALGMYAMPRFAMPVTKARTQSIKEWIARKWLNWKHNRAQQKAGKAEKDAGVTGEQSQRRKHE